jgi:hypothetical protein
MIGKRMALALAVALLGMGITVAPPARVGFAQTSTCEAPGKCHCKKRVACCKKANKVAAACRTRPTRKEKKACRKLLKMTIATICHSCVSPCSSPSGAFLAAD